jgi:hypothetical protein
MIDLDHRTGGIVPILRLTATERKDVIEALKWTPPRSAKMAAAIEIVREKTNVDLLLCELHAGSLCSFGALSTPR